MLSVVPLVLPDLAGLEPAIRASLLGAGAGLTSMAHCAAMCGPLAAFGCAPAGTPRDRWAPLRWLAGRTAAYALLGGIVAAASGRAAQALPGALAPWVSLALGAALFLSAFGLLRRGPSVVPLRAPRPRSVASRLGAFVLARRPSPLWLGVLTALLPCGALWAGLAAAATSGRGALGALGMVCFSLASAPGLGLAAFTSSRIERADPALRRLLGGVLLLGALVLVLRPLVAGEAAGACHTGAGLVGSLP